MENVEAVILKRKLRNVEIGETNDGSDFFFVVKTLPMPSELSTLRI